MPAHLKVLALISFMLVVVATPREWFAAYAFFLAVLVTVGAVARVRPGWVLKRMVVETPFVVFAVLMPFIAHGPRVEVLGLSLSESGLLSAWGLLAKGTLGVIAGLMLAATTTPQELVHGLERLRLPQQLVQIMAFMVRYLEVVTDEMRRMAVARASRGFEARNPLHWPVLARSVGALFIRSFERGERVHLAMVSRGYTGRMPTMDRVGRR
ncbi:cobalt ECF transporter T component CbiQ [Nocardioides sp. NPDC023903]|uniref:cobalt ECF transporter T component CbiQ n=1 Tax=Nocardioides sp. NPDC023903 TaxID=3157195 RepID=UPI0033D2CEE8